MIAFWYFAGFSIAAFLCGYVAGRLDESRSQWRAAMSEPDAWEGTD